MRQLLFILACCVGLVGPAQAQSDEIKAVIGNQIEAFLADDFATAFTFASPMIREIFRTPENFGSMVRNGYPMVWRPAEIRYLGLEEREGTLWQLVRVTDRQGLAHVLAYQMVNLESGWKINAVQVLETPPPSV
ncbi:DUF4864 domain-containing protein [Ruegeria pomeroyi]|jgi:hypothetical protein|uniref:DUF4864 domain-containing protein n=2 Tax=Ruegeria pomeroyi TaxID=89184 RepID=Q5LW85_RUEPO|nr:DUF4864 domain-containing protein [Ruegeria pomeroyi]HCE71247.1 DUF4864 domain-containing protein [Ruegeria sp.]AAV93775.1 hypothetical protein SPO0457 [Ruegeria pomeroyi DSS-3]NVK98631.1 DUF4864 domain-containing protein [Ruegeria pomeroyi]NVL03866.1 DUF4864 domain-containing protein [Ruegeria pomeroyi]QWV07365.1 DUF4864 domain-containing protein [Ruegeria pomeroyi]